MEYLKPTRVPENQFFDTVLKALEIDPNPFHWAWVASRTTWGAIALDYNHAPILTLARLYFYRIANEDDNHLAKNIIELRHSESETVFTLECAN